MIRNVELELLKLRDNGSVVEQFVTALAATLRPLKMAASAWTKTPKFMVRADDLDTLYDLQRLIDRMFRTQSVVVHDRAKPGRR